jgi:hypothetical protein
MPLSRFVRFTAHASTDGPALNAQAYINTDYVLRISPDEKDEKTELLMTDGSKITVLMPFNKFMSIFIDHREV